LNWGLNMKKRYLLLLIFLTTLTAVPSYGATNYYSQFIKYNKAKNKRLALKYIRLAHLQKPNNKTYGYWYGIVLNNAKKYRQAITIFKKLGTDYKPLQINWYIGQAYKNRGDFAQATVYLKKALEHPDTKDCWKRYAYNSLIDVLIKVKKADDLLRWEEEILKYYKPLAADKSKWVKYKMCRFYLEQAIELAKLKKIKRSTFFYSKCKQMLALGIGNLRKYIYLYKYALVFSRQKKYLKAAKLLENLPDYKKSQAIYWYLYQAYSKAKMDQKAIASLRKGLSTKKKKKSWNQFFYSRLLQLLTKTENVAGVIALEKKALGYLHSTGAKSAFWYSYLVAKFYRDKGYEMMAKDRADEADDFFRRALSRYHQGLGKHKKYFNSQKIVFIRKVNRFWQDKRHLADQAYQHKFLFIVLQHIDAFWKDKNGKKHHTKYSIKDSVKESYKPAYSQFKKIIYYLTKGQIHLRFKTVIHPGTVRNIRYSLWKSAKGANGKSAQEIDIYAPVIETMTPDPGEIFYKQRNNFDSFVTVFPSKGITGVCTGGMTRLSYVPLLKSSRHLRGKINMASTTMGGNSARTLVHEFFHNIEGAYRKWNKFPAHVYQKAFRRYWPVWYQGQGELQYYKKFFEKIVFPNNINRLYFRDKKEKLTQKEYQQKRNQFSNYSIKNLKKAKKLYQKGWKLFWKTKQYNQAIAVFKKSLTLFPDDDSTHELLGHGLYKTKQFKLSLIHYRRAIALDKPTRQRLEMIATLLRETKKISQAAAAYKSLYEQHPTHPVYLYYLARCYKKGNQFRKAVACYNRYLHNHIDQNWAQYALNNSASILISKFKDYKQTRQLISTYWKQLSGKKMAPYIAINMAIAYGEDGDKQEARRWINKAEELGYKYPKNLKYYRWKYRE